MMNFLHSMLRVSNLQESLYFYIDALGLEEVRRKDVPDGKFTLIFLKAPGSEAEIELTYNWDSNENYGHARNFGHLAFSVQNIYESCERLISKGVNILRPPRDGYMAFVKSPDNISIELLQAGDALKLEEPWLSMKNNGNW